MITLALDISTHTGWAILVSGEVVDSGTIHLATAKELSDQRKEGFERTNDKRFGVLLDFIASKKPDRIVFEDVQFSSTQMQGQLWASLRSTIWAYIHLNKNVESYCVPVGTLKQFATGKGNALKIDMANALSKKYPGSSVTPKKDTAILHRPGKSDADDNEVDAIWLAMYTKSVDDGISEFSGVYKRKMEAKAEKRKKDKEKLSKIKKSSKVALSLVQD